MIFTAALKDYANWAISCIGDGASEQFISFRLFRQHALPCKDFYIKDLSLLGRDLSKTLIVDNTPENFLMQPDNGIPIASWYDDEADTHLVQMATMLVQIVQTRPKDIRVAYQRWQEQYSKLIDEGEEGVIQIDLSAVAENNTVEK